MTFDFEINFIPETEDEKTDARKQRIANMTDKYPALVEAMSGKTWEEIYRIPMVRQKS